MNEKDVKDQCDQIGRYIVFGELFKACGNNYVAQIADVLVNFG